MTTDDDLRIEEGSGDVFIDCGFSPEEAQELRAKSACIRRISTIKAQRRWTQSRMGKAMGMSQSEVSQLLAGKVSRFSLERLMLALRSLGVGVRITLVDEPGMGLVVDDRVGDAVT